MSYPRISRVVAAGLSCVAITASAHAGTDWRGVLIGDADLDGVVSAADFDTVTANAGTSGPRVSWRDGDFDRDGDVDGADLLLCLSAIGNTLDAIPIIAGIDLDTTDSFSGNTLTFTMIDVANGSRSLTLGSGGRLKFWSPSYASQFPNGDTSAYVQPAVEMIRHEDASGRCDGVDFEITYTNTHATEARALGRIHIEGLTLDGGPTQVAGQSTPSDVTDDEFSFTLYNPLRTGAPGDGVMRATWDGTKHFDIYSTLLYPGRGYAPVIPVSNGPSGYTLGMSVIYPLTEYQHAISFNVRTYDDSYAVTMFLNMDDETMTEAGHVQPGETRVYTVSLRAMRNAEPTLTHENEWLRTLTPYRRFFQHMYGPVRYTKDPRHIMGRRWANRTPGYDTGNPYQFMGGGTSTEIPARIDEGGLVTNINGRDRLGVLIPGTLEWYVARGWERINIRRPVGAMVPRLTPTCEVDPSVDPIVQQDSPFLATELDRVVSAKGTLRDRTELVDFANSTAPSGRPVELSFWWGDSDEVMDRWFDDISIIDPWNDISSCPMMEAAERHPLDPYAGDPGATDRVNFALGEFDAGLAWGLDRVNCGGIGYDIPYGDQLHWYRSLLQRSPGIDLTFEPFKCDILNTVGAGYFSPGYAHDYTTPHYLAEFLNPGFEMWMQTLGVDLRTEFETLVLDGLGLPTGPRAALYGFPTTLSEFYIAYVELHAGNGFNLEWINLTSLDEAHLPDLTSGALDSQDINATVVPADLRP